MWYDLVTANIKIYYIYIKYEMRLYIQVMRSLKERFD